MDFAFVSGNLGLDLVGTVGRRRTTPIDLLVTPADLARWTVAARLLDSPPATTEDDLAAAVALREAIHRLAALRSEGRDTEADREVLNRAAHRPPASVRLDPDDTVARTGDVHAALSTVARAAIELLGGPQAALIRECEAEPCTRLYVDTSNRGTRRWCDMRACGNRAKAATFRARHS